MAEGAGQPQRFCRSCGTKIRSGMSFCVSCGTPVTSVAGGPGPSSGAELPGGPRSFFDDLRSNIRQSMEGFGRVLSGLSTDGFRRLPGRALGWFRDLPRIPKLVLVGSIALVLLVFLSPVAAIAAGLLFAVSLVILIVRVAQKRSVENWGIVTVVSLVVMFAFGGISYGLYGGGENASSEQDGGGTDATPLSVNGGEASPVASPTASPVASPSASPSALAVGDETTITGEVFGYAETFNYDGRIVTGTVVDWNGNHIMVIQDPMQGGGSLLGYATPGDEVTVTGEYQGTITTSEGFSYEAVMAEDVESVDQ